MTNKITIFFPVTVYGAFVLNGHPSICKNIVELEQAIANAMLASPISEVLVRQGIETDGGHKL
jgi:hypothetical protein